MEKVMTTKKKGKHIAKRANTQQQDTRGEEAAGRKTVEQKEKCSTFCFRFLLLLLFPPLASSAPPPPFTNERTHEALYFFSMKSAVHCSIVSVGLFFV
jgi:hypothetical protein